MVAGSSRGGRASGQPSGPEVDSSPPPPHLPSASPEQRKLMADLASKGKSAAEIMAAALVSRSAARHAINSVGQTSSRGRKPFFLPEEEELLARYVRTRALIGRGLTRDAFLDTCEEYILAFSPERQATARARFNAKTRPGKGFFSSFLSRWPALKRYRFGTLEDARAKNSRPDVLARWFATVQLCMRDLGIKHGR